MRPSFFAELKRRNVVRAAVLYIGAVWALSQGIAQLAPFIGAPEWVVRWFLVACVIGFPFWIAFAWFFAWTPQGFKREEDVDRTSAQARATGRTLDFWIIGTMAAAIVLLVTNTFVLHRDATSVADKADANAVAAALAKVPAQSIAVLPFENLSNDKSNEYFVAGMQDLILTKLADIGSLKVIARSSTQSYGSHPQDLKTIGAQLGVATILEGSVQKAGNDVLINVQLIDARTDAHIWAEAYTRTLTNVFGVEGEVATQVATSLNAKLSPAQHAELAAVPTRNRAAYDAFLRAEYLITQGDDDSTNGGLGSYKAALSLYRQAVEADPGFALAWAYLSWEESRLAWFGGGGESIPQLQARARADAQ